jgi:hypothetical protein
VETGRTHQIRVHMAVLRHLCVGGLLYGAARLGLTRQWPHSVRLSFSHPATGAAVSFDSPVRRGPSSRPRRAARGDRARDGARGLAFCACMPMRELSRITRSSTNGVNHDTAENVSCRAAFVTIAENKKFSALK